VIGEPEGPVNANVSVSLAAPSAVGVNVIETEQEAAASTVAPQVVLEITNTVPVVRAGGEVNVNVPALLFVKVTVFAALVLRWN